MTVYNRKARSQPICSCFSKRPDRCSMVANYTNSYIRVQGRSNIVPPQHSYAVSSNRNRVAFRLKESETQGVSISFLFLPCSTWNPSSFSLQSLSLESVYCKPVFVILVIQTASEYRVAVCHHSYGGANCTF